MDMRGGYLGKLLRVNLRSRRSTVEDIEPRDYELFLGGRGLGALWYWREVGPEVSPFDAENKIAFVTGPLTGTPLVSTTKMQLATKGPETGHYLCSNSGGNFGPRLREAGFDALVLEEVSDHWSALVVENENVQFIEADSWRGLSPQEARARVLGGAAGSRWASLSVGPAAENRVAFSSIMVDDGRAFGRGGAGAVLAAKRVKAIAVRGDRAVPVADPEACREMARRARAELTSSRATHHRLGTAQLVEIVNELGCMPTCNFQTSWEDASRVEGVYAQTLHDHFFIKNYACYRCSVACGQVAKVREGPFAGAQARPEYESIGLLGPSCGIYDMAAVIAANEVCDRLGMDTITAGNLVAVAMELFERGLVTPDENEGLGLHFGDADGLLRMLHLIAERRGLGAILADGALGVLKARPEWAPYLMHSKGMTFAAYDPRGFHGMGLAYATSSRGACHNVGGFTVSEELLGSKYDRYAVEGKARLVKTLQDNRAYIDSLGLCTVVRGAFGLGANPARDALSAVFGSDIAPQLMTIGERIVNLERLILIREGIGRSDDSLPPRMQEPLPSGPAAGHRISDGMLQTMLDEYYAVRGWDTRGQPLPAKMRELDLDQLAAAGR